jgi:hypothetical protein
VYYKSNGVLALGKATDAGPAYMRSSSIPTFGNFRNLSATVNLATAGVFARCNNTYFPTARAAEIDQENSGFKITTKLVRSKRPSIRSLSWNYLRETYNTPME